MKKLKVILTSIDENISVEKGYGEVHANIIMDIDGKYYYHYIHETMVDRNDPNAMILTLIAHLMSGNIKKSQLLDAFSVYTKEEMDWFLNKKKYMFDCVLN